MKNQILEALQKMLTKRVPRAEKNDRGGVDRVLPQVKPLYCADGKLDVSVQASRKHFCTPRTDEGPYTHVEVGFPSIKPPASWAQYCAGDYENKACETSYRNVPLELVAEFIEQHGGIKAAIVPAMIVPPVHVVQPKQEQKRSTGATLEDMLSDMRMAA